MEQYVPQIISPYQTGFLPGCNIHENIVVTKDMFHTMHQMKRNKGVFAIKVDLAKTYDRLNWNSIWRTLVEIQFPDEVVNVVMHVGTTVTTNVNWNGDKFE